MERCRGGQWGRLVFFADRAHSEDKKVNQSPTHMNMHPRKGRQSLYFYRRAHHGLVPPRAAERSAAEEHFGDAGGVRGRKLQRGRVAGLEESPRAERGQVAGEADEWEQLGLGAVAEAILRNKRHAMENNEARTLIDDMQP